MKIPTFDNCFWFMSPKYTMSKKLTTVIELNVLRVEVFHGEQTFVDECLGKEYHIRKLPDQPEDTKTLKCEFHKIEDGVKTIIFLRQHIQSVQKSAKVIEANRAPKPQTFVQQSVEYWTENL